MNIQSYLRGGLMGLALFSCLHNNSFQNNFSKEDGLLISSCSEGHKDSVRELLAKGARPGAVPPDGLETPLMVAARLGYKDIVEILLKESTIEEINRQNSKGETALMRTFTHPLRRLPGGKGGLSVHAGKELKTEIALLLLDSGADITIQDNLGQTAPMHAISSNFVNLPDKEKACGDENDTSYFPLFLQKAFENGKMDVNFQNSRNPKISEKVFMPEGSTLLMYTVCYTYRIDCVKKLIKCKANLGLKDIAGRTALIRLLEQTDIEPTVAKILIEAMSEDELALCDNQEKTALIHFLEKRATNKPNVLEIASLLIGRMKVDDLFKKDKQQKSALMYLLDREVLTESDMRLAEQFIEKMDSNTSSEHLSYIESRKKNPGIVEKGAKVFKDALKQGTQLFRSARARVKSALSAASIGSSFKEKKGPNRDATGTPAKKKVVKKGRIFSAGRAKNKNTLQEQTYLAKIVEMLKSKSDSN